jgi:hypothetical protein
MARKRMIAERPYIATRNAKILRLIRQHAPKDIVTIMNLTSVSIVYEAVRRHKRRQR